jgi:MFS family permease
MWFCITGYFLYNLIGFSVATNAAFVMSKCGIGTFIIGIIMTISTGGSILAGFLLGRITKAFRNQTLAFALAFLAAGFILLNLVRIPSTFVLATALYGFGFGIFTPTMVLKIIDSVPRHATTLALSIASCAMGLGQFASPITFSFLNGLLGLHGARASWMIAAAAFTAAFLIVFATTLFLPHKAAEHSSVRG